MDFYNSLMNPQQTGVQDPMMQNQMMPMPMQDPMMMQGQMMQGQMMQMPMQDPMMMQGQQMGYPQYNQTGMMGYGYPRVTKASVIQEIQNFVINATGKPITQVIKLDDIDQQFRHACAEHGDVSFLELNYFPVPMIGVQVAYYFCLACGRLYIQRDFM